jgi:hypothetical protein
MRGLDFIPFLIFGVVIPISSFLIGASAEKDRQYEKCLGRNSEMLYNAAIEFCKGQVK